MVNDSIRSPAKDQSESKFVENEDTNKTESYPFVNVATSPEEQEQLHDSEEVSSDDDNPDSIMDSDIGVCNSKYI